MTGHAYRYIDGYEGESRMFPKERQALLNAVPQAGLVYEIGTWHGVTCAWIASQRPEVLFVCIDPFVQGERTPAGDIQKWHRNKRKNMRLFVGTLAEYVELFGRTTPQADVIIVDGSHSYRDCLDDFTRAYSFLKVGGTVAVHDYGAIDEVTRAADEAMERFRLGVYDTVGMLRLLREGFAPWKRQ